VKRELLNWADRIFVMCEREDQHHTLIKMGFPDVTTPVVDLDVEDNWTPGAETAPAQEATPAPGRSAKGRGNRVIMSGTEG
jgi:hypothetical protein